MNEQIANILRREVNRQDTTIELIASENFASDSIMALAGSEFTNKYAEGYPGNRYYNGCEHMDEIETLAINELKKLFNVEYANVQPHSGANANTAAFQALISNGDTILGMDLSAGGHLSHGSPVNISGKLYKPFYYGVSDKGLLDYDEILRIAKECQPKLIIAGASAYSRHIDWGAFKRIADEVGAYLLADISHYSGLIAGGVYPSPVGFADVITSTTHKTLRGPRGGVIMWNNPKLTRKINSAIFPGTQGGPLMHIVAAKAQCFIEANTIEFKEYTKQVILNAKEMSSVFIENGINVISGGTDSHMILIDVSSTRYNGKEAADLLEENGITVNKNSIPNDTLPFTQTSGIRIGTAAETTRGALESDFREIALKIIEVIKS
jgi:glycine hydroxymethyltransferase|tara:strand:- start:6 stop:1148 length:1143 start_codon:yes stop_codon:yes gene_type:complete